jgi:hypothetical protein
VSWPSLRKSFLALLLRLIKALCPDESTDGGPWAVSFVGYAAECVYILLLEVNGRNKRDIIHHHPRLCPNRPVPAFNDWLLPLLSPTADKCRARHIEGAKKDDDADLVLQRTPPDHRDDRFAL